MIILIFLRFFHFSVAFVHSGSSSEKLDEKDTIDHLVQVIEGIKLKMMTLEMEVTKLKVIQGNRTLWEPSSASRGAYFEKQSSRSGARALSLA